MSIPNAIDYFVARATREEGIKQLPYDDATDKPVVAPIGKLSWGIGFNLMTCGSLGLFKVMLQYLCFDLAQNLGLLSWYNQMDPVRQSVFLDIAYNAGFHGLVAGFPRMIAAATVGDWKTCAAECKVVDPKLDASRYAPLRQIIISGVSTL